MHLRAVISSNLDQVGYDASKLQLVIVFKDGAAYRYDGVSTELYQQLLQAESKGKFFSAHVRKAFPFVRLRARAVSEAAQSLSLMQVRWQALEFDPAYF